MTLKQESIWGAKNFSLACTYLQTGFSCEVPNADHFDRNFLKYFIIMLAYKIKSEQEGNENKELALLQSIVMQVYFGSFETKERGIIIYDDKSKQLNVETKRASKMAAYEDFGTFYGFVPFVLGLFDIKIYLGFFAHNKQIFIKAVKYLEIRN